MHDRPGALDDNPDPGRFRAGSSPPTGAQPTSLVERRIWRPEPGAGRLVGGGLTAFALLLTLLAAQQVLNSGGAVRVLWVLVALAVTALAAFVCQLLVRLVTLRYVLDEASLVIAGFGQRVEVPYGDMIDVEFRPRDVIEIDGYERYWPGYYDSINATSDGPWRSIATTPPNERVRIRTRSGATFALSPERPVLFVDALDVLRRGTALPSRPVPRVDDDEPPVPTGLPASRAPDSRQAARPAVPDRPPVSWPQINVPRPLAYRIFRERIVHGDPVASRLLALSLLVLIVLVFMAAWKVDSVNRPLAIAWNANGEPTWFVRPDGFWIVNGVWIYPVTAGAIIAVNCALATLAIVFERVFEARLLLSAAFVTSGMLLIGMVATTGLI